MLVSRDAIRAFGWILVLTLSMVGCQTAPEQIPSKGFTDDFGGDVPTREEITVESVQDKEMLHQRAQLELRLGGSFPFDLFDPGRDPYINSFGENGPAHGSGQLEAVAGGKLQLETAKNVYLGLAFDWTVHSVEPNTQGLSEQVFALEAFERLSVVGTVDYDIPLTEDAEGLLLRLGMGIGMTVVDFKTLPSFLNNPAFGKVEDLYQIMFRPSLGLRLPVSDNLLLFSELTYDIVPERSIAFETDTAIAGERAIFSSGALIFGISFQW